MSKSNKDINTVLASASKLASYNMFLQLSFRVLTFILNAFVLRHVTKETLGVVNVRLLLLYSTILFMSREAFRRACLSSRDDVADGEKDIEKNVKWKQTINLLWCMVPVGVVWTIFLVYCWRNLFENPDPAEIPHYPLAVVVFGCCACLELIAEPLWVLAQVFLFVKLKVVAEGLAILIKCLVTVSLVVAYPHWGLVSFCIAQVSFSITYICAYYGYFIWFIKSKKSKQSDDFPLHDVNQLFPQLDSNKDEKLIDSSTAKLSLSFFKQSVLKQILTEGERYVMTILNVLSFADQGVYDVINNLGSLAARFIFLPIEESFYLFFAKTLKRGAEAKQQPMEEIVAVTKVFGCLLRLVVIIGAVILSFGVPYSHLLLDLYGGTTLSSGPGPMLLNWYCLYVLAIAINGTTECFVFAVMDQNDLDKYNKKMLLFSILFLSCSYYLTKAIGSVGFIIANCLNMIARILHSVFYINRYYSSFQSITSPLLGLIPGIPVILTLCLSSILCMVSQAFFCCSKGLLLRVLHVTIGAVCCIFTAAVIWFTETDVVQFLKDQFLSKYFQKKKAE
ncbi:man(5)GlcNAc(2)-PP-dolichol translocation protein RFT1-like [Ciona intestinalis]